MDTLDHQRPDLTLASVGWRSARNERHLARALILGSKLELPGNIKKLSVMGIPGISIFRCFQVIPT
jgi:hypothetical protein